MASISGCHAQVPGSNLTTTKNFYIYCFRILFLKKCMYQNFELYNPCVILSAPIIIINHLLNVSYFGYILHTRLKSYISKFGAVQSLDNFICINNTYQPFAETFLFWLHPARKIQSTIGYHNTLYVLYIVHVLRYSLVAIIPACHAEDPGSNPSLTSTFLHFYQHTGSIPTTYAFGIRSFLL